MRTYSRIIQLTGVIGILFSCQQEEPETSVSLDQTIATFGDLLPVNPTYDYEGQEIPNYITKDNSGTNTVSDKGATLGRFFSMIKTFQSIKRYHALPVTNKPMHSAIRTYKVRESTG